MIGLRLNNYELVSVIGEGGMGTVYLARHTFTGRKAAVKLLHLGQRVPSGIHHPDLNKPIAITPCRFDSVKAMALVPTSMEEDVKQHNHPSPGDAVIVASGVHPRS